MTDRRRPCPDCQEWERLAALMRERERPWIKRWQRETGNLHVLPDYGVLLAWLAEKADVRNE